MPFWNTAVTTRADGGGGGSRDTIVTVTGTDFDDVVLRSGMPAAVEFMSYGCVHCRAMEPVLQQVAESLGTSETIFRVNADIDHVLERA